MLNAKHTTRFLENKRRRQTAFRSAMDMSGLAAVLIVIIWVALVDSPHHSSGIDLPRVQHGTLRQSAQQFDALIIVILRDGKVFIDATQVSPEGVTAKVADRLQKDAAHKIHRTLFLKVDRRAHYRPVKEVVDELRQAGVDKVVILTEDLRASTKVF